MKKLSQHSQPQTFMRCPHFMSAGFGILPCVFSIWDQGQRGLPLWAMPSLWKRKENETQACSGS